MKQPVASQHFLLAFVVALTAGFCQQSLAEAPKAQNSSSNFIRVQRDANKQPVALETSIARYTPKDSGDADRAESELIVDLISAVHVGEKSYYEALNKRFDDYEAVLYELVAPEGTRIPKGGGRTDRNALSAVQNGMKDVLELEYQLAGIDYTKKNFVHADLTPEQFAKSMKDKGESFWSIFIRMMGAGIAQQAAGKNPTSDFELLAALFSEDRALKLKRIMANQFADMDIMMAAFNGPDGSTLITERNKAALEVLKREIGKGKKKIAIFYGGGHMPDLEQRLLDDFAMKRRGVDWLEAWDLRDKK